MIYVIDLVDSMEAFHLSDIELMCGCCANFFEKAAVEHFPVCSYHLIHQPSQCLFILNLLYTKWYR
jgi:hypothetical protein